MCNEMKRVCWDFWFIHFDNLDVEGSMITFSTEDLVNHIMLEWWIMTIRLDPLNTCVIGHDCH